MSGPDGERQGRVPLIVEREYQPDPARCIAGVAMVLAWAAERRAREAEPRAAEPTTPITDAAPPAAPPASAPPGA